MTIDKRSSCHYAVAYAGLRRACQTARLEHSAPCPFGQVIIMAGPHVGNAGIAKGVFGMKNMRTFWRAIGVGVMIAAIGLGMAGCDIGGSAAAGNGGGGGGSGNVPERVIYGTWGGYRPGIGNVTVVIRPDSTWTIAIPTLHMTEGGIFTRIESP